MTTFKEIRGTTIEVVSTDPTNPELGQIWYNSSSGTLKGLTAATVGWTSGGTMINARYGQAGFGTQTAALAAGGINGPTYKPQTELYNGTAWTANPTGMNTNRYVLASAGNQTAGVAFGGDAFPWAQTELWNGSVWTNNPTGLNFPGENIAGCGTQTAALAIGGTRPGGPTGVNSNKTESFNGSTWTAGGNLNTARTALFATGIQTAALAFGGAPTTTRVGATESYNGSAWTSVNSMNTARNGLAGSGTQTLAAAFGGDSGSVTGATELWNGTSWTTSTSMSTARTGASGAGTQAAGLAFAGYNGTTGTGATEEFTGPGSFSTKTITVS
jgi:hypothetical protein